MRLARLPSLRLRLALWYALSLGGVLAVFAAATLVYLWTTLVAELDHQVFDHLEFAQHMLARTPDGGFAWQGADPAASGEAAWWMTVRDSNGAEVFRLGVPSGDGAGVRRMSASHVVGGLPVVIEVAKSEAAIRERLLQLVFGMALALPLAMLGAGFGGYALARRALAPVGAMAARARSITAERLADRLPVDPSSGELAELAAVFNATLARLEHSFEQLRRFTADASHELRTPLTVLRSVGEVGLREARDAAAYRDVVGSMLEETDRMTQLVDGLLVLSRADAGRVALHRVTVDLRALARNGAAQLSVLAEEKAQRLEVEEGPPVPFEADPLVLRHGLANVIHNAIKYSADGASVHVRVRARPDDAVIEITDDGPGIAPEHASHIFERFYRVDPARARSSGGTGLGLSIARWAAEAHGGRLELESRLGQGATFRFVLPACPRPAFG